MGIKGLKMMMIFQAIILIVINLTTIFSAPLNSCYDLSIPEKDRNALCEMYLLNGQRITPQDYPLIGMEYAKPNPEKRNPEVSSIMFYLTKYPPLRTYPYVEKQKD